MPRLRLPPFLEAIPVLLTRIAENVVDSLAEVAYRVISGMPMFEGLTEEEKRALAYAVVGDIIASPIPEPLDVPIDIVIQERIRQFLPSMPRYRQMYTRIAEFLPILELLPNYTIAVLSSIREREVRSTNTVLGNG